MVSIVDHDGLAALQRQIAHLDVGDRVLSGRLHLFKIVPGSSALGGGRGSSALGGAGARSGAGGAGGNSNSILLGGNSCGGLAGGSAAVGTSTSLLPNIFAGGATSGGGGSSGSSSIPATSNRGGLSTRLLQQVLSHAFPEYDYATVTDDRFEAHADPFHIVNSVNCNCLSLAERENPGFINGFWRVVRECVDLPRCSVFSYKPESLEEVPGTPLFSFFHFFLDKSEKKLLFLFGSTRSKCQGVGLDLYSEGGGGTSSDAGADSDNSRSSGGANSSGMMQHQQHRRSFSKILERRSSSRNSSEPSSTTVGPASYNSIRSGASSMFSASSSIQLQPGTMIIQQGINGNTTTSTTTNDIVNSSINNLNNVNAVQHSLNTPFEPLQPVDSSQNLLSGDESSIGGADSSPGSSARLGDYGYQYASDDSMGISEGDVDA
ncbi:unnamed protein product [Amoebophrya sp. A25]|nr:unnamed protein product [Amoebophrya sp. A25]|eukprot:GSA25T00027106001.1